MVGLLALSGDWVPAVIWPVVSIVVGVLVYVDATRRGRDRPVAAMAAVILGGLLLAGSVPALVALAVSDAETAQGFPTAIRILPGLTAIAVYLFLRQH